MEGITTFTSDKEDLNDILKELHTGNIQLPEFQRGWIWDDDHIRSLISSISLSYPIGSVMMLENGNPDVRFKPRPVEGVILPELVDPERFILDGQQRLTSLYQALCLNNYVVTTDSRKKVIKRWYYIKMAIAINPYADRDDAIIGLPEDRKIVNFRKEVQEDYSTPELEYEHGMFPLSKIFDPSEWRWHYNKFWDYDKAKSDLFDNFEKTIVDTFKKYKIPVIELKKGTPKVAVCQVFEKVNTGGVALDVFELLTASFAADGFNLREDWYGKQDEKGIKIAEGKKDTFSKHQVLKSVAATDFMQAITLLSTYERKLGASEMAVSCKRADVLKLQLIDYKRWSELAMNGFVKAAKFLFQQKIFSNKDIPYNTQLVPLSALFALLEDKADNDTVRDKLGRWYWCGVFGELYGSAVESRFANDVVQVMNWIDGGPEPNTVAECNFAPTRLYTLKTRGSAAYKGLYALLIKEGGLDFRSGVPIDVQTYFEESIDIHHIFPQKYSKGLGISPREYDCIINKTPLSARTNKIIGGNAPSVYLNKIMKEYDMTKDRVNDILVSHVIDVDVMWDDEFREFFALRREELLKRIEVATGKTIARESEEEISKQIEEEVFIESVDEEGEEVMV